MASGRFSIPVGHGWDKVAIGPRHDGEASQEAALADRKPDTRHLRRHQLCAPGPQLAGLRSRICRRRSPRSSAPTTERALRLNSLASKATLRMRGCAKSTELRSIPRPVILLGVRLGASSQCQPFRRPWRPAATSWLCISRGRSATAGCASLLLAEPRFAFSPHARIGCLLRHAGGARVMLGSTVLKCTDPWEYQEAIRRAGDVSTVIAASGNYQSEVTLVDLHRLGLQQARTSLPRIVRGASNKNQCSVMFPTTDNQAHVTFNGIEVPQSYLLFFCPGAEHVASASAKEYWAGISLTPETLASASQALVGYEIATPKATQIIRAPSPSMVRLQNLHDAATRLAATVPDLLVHPEVSRAVEQELLRALITCLADSATIKNPSPNRQGIMQRFHQVVEANQHELLYISEVCASIGVPERTLLKVCSEYLGTSPHRYLWLRRMNLARRALTLADPTVASVTMIANDHGFGELGRFAVAYRNLFGESPSATLRRTP